MNRNGMEDTDGREDVFASESIIVAEFVPEPPAAAAPPPPLRQRRVRLPLALFILTCLSTYLIGGLSYSICLMTILLCHEMGHFLQAWRYGVPASLPFFIPVPIPPIGTMGAVIGMSGGMTNRRALFDIGITGPLAGLVPTLIFLVVGFQESKLGLHRHGAFEFGEPLLFKLFGWLQFGPIPEGQTIYTSPMAFAAWVGLLITSLNLIPIGQLDGGHVLYALLRKRAHRVASWLLMSATAAVVVAALWFQYPAWILMLLILILMGPKHPPTRDDDVPLGPVRVVLGWLTLAFIFVGFTPMPFVF